MAAMLSLFTEQEPAKAGRYSFRAPAFFGFSAFIPNGDM